MSDFALYLGIDYSGAQTPTSRLKNLQVFAAQPGGVPQKRFSPALSNNGQGKLAERAVANFQTS